MNLEQIIFIYDFLIDIFFALFVAECYIFFKSLLKPEELIMNGHSNSGKLGPKMSVGQGFKLQIWKKNINNNVKQTNLKSDSCT